MKKILVFLMLFVAIAINSIYAQSIEVSAQSMFRSKYVGPDGLTFYDKPVVQSGITFEHKSGLYFDIWVSSGFDSKFVNGGWDDEIDYTLGWSGKVSKFNLDVAAIYFDDTKLFFGPYNDVVVGEITLNATKEFGKSFTLSPYVKFASYWVPDKTTEFSGGNLYSVGANSELLITKVLKLSKVMQLTYDDGAFDVDPGIFLNVSATLDLEVTDRATWNVVELVYYVPIGKRPNMVNEFTIGTGISWSF